MMAFSFNINIQRNIAELNILLNNSAKNQKEFTTLKHIQEINETVICDLDRIYRIRNKIIHFGAEVDENLEIVIERLFRYLNSVLLIFIHHIKKNPNLTIAETLFSIITTYDWYIQLLSTGNCDPQSISSPSKLFI